MPRILSYGLFVNSPYTMQGLCQSNYWKIRLSDGQMILLKFQPTQKKLERMTALISSHVSIKDQVGSIPAHFYLC